MDTLRWILLLLGIMILAGIYLAGRVRQPRRPRDLDDDGIDADELEHVHIRADEGFTPSSSHAEEAQPVGEDPLASRHQEPVFDEVGVGEVRVVHRDTSREDDAEPTLGQEPLSDSDSGLGRGQPSVTERPTRSTRSRGHGGASRRPRRGKPGMLARLKSSLPKPSLPGIKAPGLPGLGQLFRGKGTSSSVDEAPADESEAAASAQPEAEDKIIVLHVVAPNQERFLGVNLQAALAEMGLEHGDMGIYHLNVSDGQRTFTLFSLANMVKPGSFDPETMDVFTTPGVSLFLRLPGPCDPLESFDAMLTCAERLAERLNGQVLDASRSAVTPQGNQHTREDIRQWKLHRGL
ncbi:MULTISPECIES: cell division protein ZipA [unclassified Ectothiorhodospira]|uniref:cell division protein ZipA n=1 Tax=unclassified Ectothiorhodospira TaxID=2684909 RepID=UPI001EE8EF5D|nr:MULTISPECIES: cell division protein ZipA [unclassified Ectothiorhodospira]MCG5516019.1 cell division protein ZipA [Ectothiorhodospira sp. 9100]MCG5519073.1 cell division protein ZipA [Ectothiorhodospira sp. 9905]